MAQPDRITLVLRAVEGGSLDLALPFVQLGAHVSIGRGLAVIAGASEGDLQADLEQQAKLHYQSTSCPPVLAGHASEMLELLHWINTECGGLDRAVAHGNVPSKEKWDRLRKAMEATCLLLESHPQLIPASKQPTFNIDEHAQMVVDAKRYRHIRDHRIDDPKYDLQVVIGSIFISGGELDGLIDADIRVVAMEKLAVQEREA